jgi:hypothetical protein
MCSLAMFQFARVRLACFGVALSMLAVAPLHGLDANPLRLWWPRPVCSLAVSVFFGADILGSLGLSLHAEYCSPGATPPPSGACGMSG